MGKRVSSRWGLLAIGLLILLLLGAVGLWWLFRPQSAQQGGSPQSPISVVLLSPTNGSDMRAGDYVSVNSKAIASTTIMSAELFVDGQSQGVVTQSPANAYWTWQAWPVGIHTLFVRVATLSGETETSQMVIVNVMAVKSTFQIPAQEGETLQQIGANYGAPPDQMAGANPKVDPSQPLKAGQPVKVPIPNGGSPGGGGQNPPAGGGSPSGPTVTVTWQIQFTQPVDLAYCYVSTGNGQWERVPKDPFTFFQGTNNTYTQIIPATGQVTIQVQCWGWVGGALQYLGEAQTTIDFNQPPTQVILTGQGFQFTGALPTPTGYGGGPTKTVPPPYALREPADVADCHAHGTLDCESFMNVQIKQDIILIWEWTIPFCWPGYCDYVDAIDGYHLYQVDPVTKAETYLHDIANPNEKEAALPLPWGPQCYGVRAYVNSPAYLESDITTYCPGEPPALKKTTFYPTAWVTSGGQWIEDGDCSDFGGLEPYLGFNQSNGFGNQVGEVMPGSYILDDSGCFKQGYYAGHVQFTLNNLPVGAVFQKAILRFATIEMHYGSTGWASPTPSSCVAGVVKDNAAWSQYSTGNHYASYYTFGAPGTPINSVLPYSALEVDVSAAVADWLANPGNNYGLGLTAAPADSPLDDGYGQCLSGLGNFQLDVYYFAP